MIKHPHTPKILLALAPNQIAEGLQISRRHVAKAIADGSLTVRCIGTKRRVAVFGEGGIQNWVESWPVATTRKRKSRNG
jgi:hypothetical protein